MLVWEYATAVAGRLLGINPFDQPDVESAKIATRALLDARPEPDARRPSSAEGIEVREAGGVELGRPRSRRRVDALLSHAARRRLRRRSRPTSTASRTPSSPSSATLLAARAKRPVTFGWGPRFLHSTGQFHKGGPAIGVFLQITQTAETDLEIPDRPFTFGQLMQAQAAGDASVLAEHGRPGADA